MRTLDRLCICWNSLFLLPVILVIALFYGLYKGILEGWQWYGEILQHAMKSIEEKENKNENKKHQ